MSAVPLVPNPIPVAAGEPFEQGFRFRPGKNADPEDLTGITWRCQWKRTADASDKIDLGTRVDDPTSGIVYVTATPAETRAMAGSGIVELESTKDGVSRTRFRFYTSWDGEVIRD